MGQINILQTDAPVTPTSGKTGIFVDSSGQPKKISDAGVQTNLAGATAFTGLTDAPSTYSGQTLKNVRVKADETGLEFYTPDAAATLRDSNTALFDKDYIIGNAGARSGNILFDFTGVNELGATTFMKHDNSGAYTFPTEGEVRDFEIAKLALVTGDVWFSFTMIDNTASSEVVFIQLSLTEAQLIEYNA